MLLVTLAGKKYASTISSNGTALIKMQTSHVSKPKTSCHRECLVKLPAENWNMLKKK